MPLFCVLKSALYMRMSENRYVAKKYMSRYFKDREELSERLDVYVYSKRIHYLNDNSAEGPNFVSTVKLIKISIG